MLLGTTPFEGEPPKAVITKHLMEPLPFPTEMPDDLSKDVKDVLLKALAKNVEERYGSAGEMAEASAEAVAVMGEEDRRQARLAELYTQAQAALKEERCADVLPLCDEILALEPNHRDVRPMRGEAEGELQREAELQALHEDATRLRREEV